MQIAFNAIHTLIERIRIRGAKFKLRGLPGRLVKQRIFEKGNLFSVTLNIIERLFAASI